MQQPTRFQLFYSLRSPFARRVRIAMQRLNVPFEPREMSVFEPPADFIEASPLGMVPVLKVNEDGESYSISDSATILEFLHENYGDKVWPSDLPVRAKVRAASTLAEGLMTLTVALFLEKQRKNTSAEWEMDYENAILDTLKKIASTPLMQLPWKVSDFQLTQAGYDLVVALEYMELRLTQMEWQKKWPELLRFMELHRNRNDLKPTTPPSA